jgi:predicted RNase H-like HicB family nuclease
MPTSFTAVYVESEDGGYVTYIEEVPGAHAHGETIEEARRRLGEALELMLQANREDTQKAFADYRVVRREGMRLKR